MIEFSKNLGIDLGTANTLIFMKNKGIILREPSVVAIDTRTNAVKSVGKDAKNVIGRTPGSIGAVRPLKDGVIADFDTTTAMLQYFIQKATTPKRSFFKPKIIICIPSGVTAVERRAVKEATEQAGAKKVYTIEEPMAAAIGASLRVEEPTGNMVVDIGGGTSEVAVISLGGIVTAQSVRVGGDEFDADIINYIKKKYNLLIGDSTAENIKIQIGSAYPFEVEEYMNIRGRNTSTGLPENIEISSAEVREALKESVNIILDTIHKTLEKTPPELSSDIIDHGITLTGGGALLRGLDKLINERTKIIVNIAKDPLDCVAKGTGAVLDNIDKLQDILFD